MQFLWDSVTASGLGFPRRADFPGDVLFGSGTRTSEAVPVSRDNIQGTLASPSPVAGPRFRRATPDAVRILPYPKPLRKNGFCHTKTFSENSVAPNPGSDKSNL